MREVQRKLDTLALATGSAHAGVPFSPNLLTLIEHTGRIHTQQRHDKNKLCALHASEVECLSKDKARKPCEFSVKVSLTVTHKQGLIVDAKRFAGNPYDGHTLAD